MFRFCKRIANALQVGWRGYWNRFGVRMPISYEVKSFAVHRINLTLFLASVRNIEMSKAEIRRSRPGRSFEHYVTFDELREQLSTRLKETGIVLLIL